VTPSDRDILERAVATISEQAQKAGSLIDEAMVRDIDLLLRRHAERQGPTLQGRKESARRGLLRLREMAAYLGTHPGGTIKAFGD
jgi:hypothetical protein